MDAQTALAKCAQLDAEHSALEQQLAAPGIDKDKRHDIRQQMISVTNAITALYRIMGHTRAAGGLPVDTVETVVIPVKMEIGYPLNNKRLPYYAFDAIVDSRCHDKLLLSAKTWAHVVEHFGDAIIAPCDDGSTTDMPAKAVLKVRVQMSDGSWVNSGMEACKSDRDVLGFYGHLSLGILVDEPNRCLKRPVRQASWLMSVGRVDNHDCPE